MITYQGGKWSESVDYLIDYELFWRDQLDGDLAPAGRHQNVIPAVHGYRSCNQAVEHLRGVTQPSLGIVLHSVGPVLS